MNRKDQIDFIDFPMLQKMALDAIKELDLAKDELRKVKIEFAEASHTYRKKKANCYLEAQKDSDEGGKKRTVDWIRAHCDATCEAEMLSRNLTEAIAESQKQVVESARTKISAIQTLLGIFKADAENYKYNQTEQI